ncbi:hypothetical protein [Dechloromonas denitrificans]|uniref:hypothetical protein n=1 Tax=Dechloromonas denitrificans TaxID=281362 RepID=UPI001CF7FFE7|nr:hypothetical protein [Dechloromonas denitrificans]UCV04104.1 hypothetical protein KI611_02205 [Dechloromonas denitrificans]UCV08366.1 hypothetical protein KI615_02215 [Dechloromonas denitrificans]
MLTLSEDALALIAERQQPVYIDVPETIEACCLEITTCPAVRFGTPRQTDQHALTRIQGAEVFVPYCFPSRQELLIRAKTFWGRHYLFIDGWKLV